MKTKTIAFIVCCMLCVCFLTACMATDPNYLDKATNIEVVFIDDPQKTTYVHYEWAVLTEEEAYTHNTVILTGVVSNVRPATLNYEYLEADCSDDITIFDIEVEEVLYCRSDAFPDSDVISVGVPYSMNNYGEGLPIIEEGSSYLLFCYVTADDTDAILDLSSYVDCWISSGRNLFCEKIGDSYLVTDFFADVPGAVNIDDALELTEEDYYALSVFDVNANSKSRSRSQIDFILKSSENTNSAEKDAWMEIRSRTRNYSPTELSYLSNLFHLIDCDVLEDHVQTVASNYGS